MKLREPVPPLIRHLTDDVHRALGRLYGIPACCIEAWVAGLHVPLRGQGALRGGIYIGPMRCYVPCPACMGGPGWEPWGVDTRFLGRRVRYRGRRYTITGRCESAFGEYYLDNLPGAVNGAELVFVRGK